MVRVLVFALILAYSSAAHTADWKPIERKDFYSVVGSTGYELYDSIGKQGPAIGASRSIAQTNWDLKWSRKYEPQGDACVLSAVKPFLTITYTLPKPTANLDAPISVLWKRFIAGIEAHEKVHGQDIIAMVKEIIAATQGLRVENDPQCKKIREQVLSLVKVANENYKSKSRAFDRTEMTDGGNVHQLILGLVNGN
jgi:predicted secreted Zn-dependent protease